MDLDTITIKPKRQGVQQYRTEVFVALRQQQLSLSEIATKLNVSELTVSRHLKRGGGVGAPRPAPRRALYLKLFHAGVPVEAIAAKLGVSENTVRRALQRFLVVKGLAAPPKGNIPRYIELLEQGRSLQEIADLCGVAKISVQRAFNRRSIDWKRMPKAISAVPALPIPLFSVQIQDRDVTIIKDRVRPIEDDGDDAEDDETEEENLVGPHLKLDAETQKKLQRAVHALRHADDFTAKWSVG